MLFNLFYSQEKPPIRYQLDLGLLRMEEILIRQSVAGIAK